MVRNPLFSLFSLLLFVSLFLVSSARSDQTNLAEKAKSALSQIRQLESQAREAMASNRQPNPSLQTKIRELAVAATAGIDPRMPDKASAPDWVKLYSYAGNENSAAALAKRIFDEEGFERMSLSVQIVNSYLADGRIRDAQRHIRYADFVHGPAMIGQFYSMIRNRVTENSKANLKETLDLFDELVSRIGYGSHLTESDANWIPYVYAEIITDKYSLLYAIGRTNEALNGFKTLQKELNRYPKSANAHGTTAKALVEGKLKRLTAEETQSGLVGRPAPSIISDQHLNSYSGAESLKGKVVILDFMAHWCGPCKAALPSLAKLQDDLGSKGVQVVSLTSFYGYYGAKQGVSRSEEFELMKNFIKEFKITWPLLFDSSGRNNINYGVSGIPHLVVVDRKGIVRKVEVGFTPETFAETRKLIEKLASTE